MDNSRIGYRPTWAEIRLANLDANFYKVRKLIGGKTKILATVKADAYGHGLVPIAQRLNLLGVDYLGVASLDEGIVLRRNGIKVPILVLGVVLKQDIEPFFIYNLTPTVCTKDFAAALARKARLLRKKIPIHVKIDTGMSRLGVRPDEALGLIQYLLTLKNLQIEGIFTHFALADKDNKFTNNQIQIFQNLVEKIKGNGLHIPLVHAANSMGIIGYPKAYFTMVRPGLMLYGLYPRDSLNIKLLPVLSLKTKVVYLKRLPAGSGVSYGHTYITPRDTTLAILPIGYGDGFPRNLSNRAPVLIGGRRFKVTGIICMDQLIVDVGDAPVKIGDEAVLIGSQGRNAITAEELACLAETIPYEIVCGIGSRVPRVYLPIEAGKRG